MRALVACLRNFWRELRRRNVFSVGGAYLVAAWGASVGAAELLPAFGAPDWAVRAFIVTAALGFPVTLVLAWVFQITPKGVVRDERLPVAAAGRTLAQTRPGGRLEVSWRDAQGSHVKQFERGFVIGRDETCDLRVDDPMVSRRHVRVRLERGVWLIEDLGSRNGTRVDGNLVERFALPRRADVRLYPNGPVLRFELAQTGATTVRAAPAGDETRISGDGG
jgi:hypothetical protein